MHPAPLRILVFLVLDLFLRAACQGLPQNGGDFSDNPHPNSLPTATILIKGAWSSASDPATPLPEGGRSINNAYGNEYFGLTYAWPAGWREKYAGPPPSASGYYVLLHMTPAGSSAGATSGSILVTAQDLFFTLVPAENAWQLINYSREHLATDYQVEKPPTPVTIGGRSFIRFDYMSPIAQLHWHVLTTQVRCHAIRFVFTSRDAKLTEALVADLDKVELPAAAGTDSGAGGGDVPVCVANYARDENVLERTDPVLTERRFNPIPVRIIIDKQGKVKHIHLLSAFPEQQKAVTDALWQWRFKPYLRDGQPVELETGIMFGRAPRPTRPSVVADEATE